MFAFRLLSLLILIYLSSIESKAPIETVMEKLIKSISDEQVRRIKKRNFSFHQRLVFSKVLKPVPFKLPEWEKKLGLYRSEIRLDFFGEALVADLRHNKFIYVFDNNMFATGFVCFND